MPNPPERTALSERISRLKSGILAGCASWLKTPSSAKSAFHPDVVLRTTAKFREALAKNPFAARPGLDSAKLAFHFLAAESGADAVARATAI